MSKSLLLWQIYEVTSDGSSLNGVMLRGRIRKFGLENSINVLAENTEDTDNTVRFAVLTDEDANRIKKYLVSILSDLQIESKFIDIPNPVLSKLKVNIESRCEL
jgi:hypothetical protein